MARIWRSPRLRGSGKVLKPGQSVTYGQLTFTVTKAERFRIKEVKLEDHRPEGQLESGAGKEGSEMVSK